MADCPGCAAEEHAERQRAKYADRSGYEPCWFCAGRGTQPGTDRVIGCMTCRGECYLPAERNHP